MIRARGLAYAFGERPVFAGVDLEVLAGEVCAVVGPSGCGKTTLLRVLAGLLEPSAGSLARPGADTAPDGAPRPAVGVAFQDPRLLPWMSLRANLDFALEATGCPRALWESRTAPLLERVGLDQAGALMPGELSGGMAQRAALVRALAIRPRVLLLDEPFSAVDPLLREALQDDLLQLLRDTGTTAVLVTHDVGEALYLADQVLVMARDGGAAATIRERVAVDLPRPRQPELRHDPRLLAMASKVRGVMPRRRSH